MVLGTKQASTMLAMNYANKHMRQQLSRFKIQYSLSKSERDTIIGHLTYRNESNFYFLEKRYYLFHA